MSQPNVLVAVSAYRGEIKAKCAASLLKLQRQFHADGVRCEFEFADMKPIARMRNYFATIAMERSDCTHLLFVDDDMDFESTTVRKLIDARVPIIGAACTQRTLDIERVAAAVKTGTPLVTATARATTYNVFLTAARTKAPVSIEAGERMQVDGIGMGVTLIDVECFRKLIATGKVGVDRSTGRPLHRFFDYFPSEASPDSEDYAFCQRWIQLCGGEVWALVSDAVGHIGEFTFRTRFLDALNVKTREP